MHTEMYNTFMESIDTIDTGVENVSEGSNLVYKECTGLSSHIGRLNPQWNKDPRLNVTERFEEAGNLCGNNSLQALRQIVESDVPAKAFVENAALSRMETDTSANSSGESVKFESGGMPWKGKRYP